MLKLVTWFGAALVVGYYLLYLIGWLPPERAAVDMIYGTFIVIIAQTTRIKNGNDKGGPL